MIELDAVLDDLRTLVEVESPSHHVDALTASAHALAGVIETRLGTAPQLVDGPVGPHVHWRGPGDPRVLVVGHHDTVFPLGTLARRPFEIADGVVRGPGVFDMKGGIVVAIHAAAALADRSGIELLLTADEEVGSGTSRALIEERAKACGAVLVLEPAAPGGVLKIGRKGTGGFEVVVHGRASHAGLEPEKGVNALVEASHQVLAINQLGRAEHGTTVTPTMAQAGTAENVVPAEARIRVDLRVTDLAEGDRVEQAMRGLTVVDPAATLEVRGGMNRPPLEESATAELYALACEVAAENGLATPAGISVGGGSDGNFSGALGIPTLDGLGVTGDGAHAEHEHAEIATLPDRITLVAGLLARLQRREPARRPGNAAHA